MHLRQLGQALARKDGKWSEGWQVEFTFTKCKTLHTGRIKNRCETNGYKLEGITKEKDLVVVINNKLSASGQVLEAPEKAPRMLGAMYRNDSYRSEKVITKLYNAYIR